MHTPSPASSFRERRWAPTTALLALTLWAMPANAQAHASVLQTDGAGAMTTLYDEGSWRSSWHLAVPGNFDGLGSSQEVLVYDRIQGEGRFVSIHPTTGNLTTLAANTGWSTGWDQIVAGNFGGSSQTDLLFYDATTGLARFYTTGAGASITLLQQHTGWNEWDTIVAGQFGGTPHSDLFLYSRTRGEGRFYTTDGAGNLTLLQSYTTLNRNWDQIVVGDFNGDSFSDLFFYQRVLGIGRFYATDGTGGLNLMSNLTGLRTAWDLVVPGQFGGSLRTDLLFYDRTAGEARFAFTDGLGGWSLQPVIPAARWSHLVGGPFGGSSTRVFAYDNSVRVRIHAVKCEDDNGGRATAITPAQVQQWIDRANIVYARAGVHIEFDPTTDFELLRDTTINTLDLCSEFSSQSQCDVHKTAATNFASNYPCKVVVFFRWGASAGATGSGFSSEVANYVAMPGFDETETTRYFQNASNPLHGTQAQGIKLLAHELGHYFGLDHTHRSFDYTSSPTPNTQVENWLAAQSNPSLQTLDADHADTWDTPPDVGIDYFLLSNLNPADLTQEIHIQVPSAGLDFTFSPDRHNVMSYFGLCDDYLRLSPDQVRKVRQVLHTAKVDRISACAHHVAGTWSPMGSGCPGTNGVVPGHSIVGTVEIGNTVGFNIGSSVPNTVAMLAVGDSSTNIPLAVIGMPGCTSFVGNAATLTVALGPFGSASVPVTIPVSTSFVGARVWSQYWVIDGGAPTPTKLVTTRALGITIGGDH